MENVYKVQENEIKDETKRNVEKIERAEQERNESTDRTN